MVFVDESGLSQRPHRVRTWSPRGVTPLLEHAFNWDNLSIAAGITLWQFYFRLYEGTMAKEEVVDFLQHLNKQIQRPMLLIWDRLPGHKSRLVKQYLSTLEDKIDMHFLPAYAPELNPAEYIWAYLKQHELANFCPQNLWHLSDSARSALRSMQRRRKIITACWKQASLF
ncbi:MAG: IS630 family transposase [Nitrospiraceae bacterium]